MQKSLIIQLCHNSCTLMIDKLALNQYFFFYLANHCKLIILVGCNRDSSSNKGTFLAEQTRHGSFSHKLSRQQKKKNRERLFLAQKTASQALCTGYTPKEYQNFGHTWYIWYIHGQPRIQLHSKRPRVTLKAVKIIRATVPSWNW